MTTVKTNQKINCANLEEARLKADFISNGVIVEKNNEYFIVNYKTYMELKLSGYNQIR